MYGILNILGIVILFFLFALVIRERVKVCNWMRLYDFCGYQVPDRKTHLKRELQRLEWRATRISWEKEDAQKELDSIKE